MKNKFLRQEDLTIDAALLGSAQGGVEGNTTTAFGTKFSAIVVLV